MTLDSEFTLAFGESRGTEGQRDRKETVGGPGDVLVHNNGKVHGCDDLSGVTGRGHAAQTDVSSTGPFPLPSQTNSIQLCQGFSS